MNANDLDQRIADALERVGQALRVQLWDAAKERGLTPTQLQVLLRLGIDPPQLRRIGALAEQLDVTHPTVSDAVGALRRKGLVDRETESRRSPLILTDEGRRVTGTMIDWQDRTLDQLGELPRADKEVTLRTLLSLIAGLQREGVISVARMCSTCRFFERDAHPGATPHHCALLDLPLAEADLRVDCPEHQPVG